MSEAKHPSTVPYPPLLPRVPLDMAADFSWLEARIDSPAKVADGKHYFLRFDVTIWLQLAEGPALTLAESIQLDPER